MDLNVGRNERIHAKQREREKTAEMFPQSGCRILNDIINVLKMSEKNWEQ
jgi:hypothetical protein